VAVLAREENVLLRSGCQDGGRRPEVHSDPSLPCAARKFDLLFGDWRPALSHRLRRQDSGRRRHGDTAAAGATRPGYLSPSMGRRSGLRSSGRNSYYQPPGFPRTMPLRFWKKEKPEKGKPEKEAEEPPKEAKEKATAKPAETAVKPAPSAKKPEEKPAPPPTPPKPGEVEVFVNEAHAGLVDLGLTVAPTKAVFAKRIAAYPGGEAAFVAEFAFLLAREPRWDKLKNPELVVIKADQTATGGECGECGAPVGKYWSDCLKCGAVFG